MESNPDLVLSTGATESSAVCDAVTNRSRRTMPVLAMMASVIDPGRGDRKRSPYLDLATKHGTAAALKAESPHLAPGKDPAGRQELRLYQRAARKVRMAAKRRRGW